MQNTFADAVINITVTDNLVRFDLGTITPCRTRTGKRNCMYFRPAGIAGAQTLTLVHLVSSYHVLIRTFSIDALRGAEILDRPAIDVSKEEMDTVLSSGYGIYAGAEVSWATLRFTPWQGRWTSNEIWHPEQRSHYDAEGRYVLEVPYSATTELIMDVLKYGPEVEVLAPDSLRQEVTNRLSRAMAQYS